MKIGIIIISISILLIVLLFVWRHIMWKKNFPPLIQNVGVIYTQGAVEWEGMDKVITLLNDKLTLKYGSDFTKNLLSHIWIEVIGPNGIRRTSTATVSEVTRIAGSVDFSKEFPWSSTYYTAVLLQRKSLPTANNSAAFHEIIEHILPIVRGQGPNADHLIPEYSELEKELHAAYKEMK